MGRASRGNAGALSLYFFLCALRFDVFEYSVAFVASERIHRVNGEAPIRVINDG